MDTIYWLMIVFAAGFAFLLVALVPHWLATWREMCLEQVCRRFHGQREHLEADFVRLAEKSGKPRGLTWSECEFADECEFARDRKSKQLRAFVEITVKFEAVEGGGMEDVEAVALHKAATAVFEHDGRHWRTQGRAIFNLSPEQAILHFDKQLEPFHLRFRKVREA